jgi:hypothetical protein
VGDVRVDDGFAPLRTADETSGAQSIPACAQVRGKAHEPRRILVELHPGTGSVFRDAGLTEVSRPTLRRAVMRIDF